MSTVIDPMTGKPITVETGPSADRYFEPGTPIEEWLRDRGRSDRVAAKLDARARKTREEREASLRERIAAAKGGKG